MQETWDTRSIPGSEDPLEEGMATHSSVLAWRIAQKEKPGQPQFLGSWRVGHDRSDLPCTHNLSENFIRYLGNLRLGNVWLEIVCPPRQSTLYIFILFLFWLHCMARGILVPRSEIELVPSAVETQGLNLWTTGKPHPAFKIMSHLWLTLDAWTQN